MKFKVTATIPVELEIDCQSKEEALNTATTILQEQRDDGDYASIVADCIESALVSGSITMTAVDNHEALVNELRTKRKISIQDMDAFLGYEIDKNDDMMFDDDYINANLWMMDVDKALGLDVCTSDNDEYVTIYVNWYPKAAERPNKREIDIFVIYAETYGDDFDIELEMDDAEYATVLADFKKKFKDTFGKSLEDMRRSKIWQERKLKKHLCRQKKLRRKNLR